jgi:N-acetylmuramoyl-L-alanine amidase
VQVELAVLTNPEEAGAVRDPAFAARAAVAVADGVERFLGAGRGLQVHAAPQGEASI